MREAASDETRAKSSGEQAKPPLRARATGHRRRRSQAATFDLGWRELTVIMCAGMVLAFLSALLLTRILDARHAVSQATTQTHSSVPSGVQVNQKAPDFTIQTWNNTNGGKFQLTSALGKPVVVNFWQTNCPPCDKEAPLLNSAYTTWSKQGVVFVGIAVTTNPTEGAAFLKKWGIKYPSGSDDGLTAAIKYGVPGTPVTFFIDRTGKVVQKSESTLTAKTLQQGIQAAMK